MNSVIRQLARWWRLEFLLRAVWGAARWVAIALAVLALACFGDWYYDRDADTPRWLLGLGLGTQLLLSAGLVLLFLVRPLRRTPKFDDLATRAERAIPELDHRLVTALQLNRPDARTTGMSPVLIAHVTREAGEIASRHRLTRLASFRPLGWAAIVAVPVLAAAGVFAAVKPELTLVLLKRQLLINAAIPRSVAIENITRTVWPTGSPVTLRFKVTGAFEENSTGTVELRPEGQPPTRVELRFERRHDDGSGEFVAIVNPPSIPFTFQARLLDGRTRTPGHVDFEPPPQVTDVQAWLLLPQYLGTRPVGMWWERRARESNLIADEPYQMFQPQGEITDALPLSTVRVKAMFSKPVARAVLITVERNPLEQGGANEVEHDAASYPPKSLEPDRLSAEWEFPINSGIVAYRIEPTDDQGFVSEFPTVRKVQMRADEPPRVDVKIESTWRVPDWQAVKLGVPPVDPEERRRWDERKRKMESIYDWPQNNIPLGRNGRIQITWEAHSDYGIGQVWIAYRVIPKAGGEVIPTPDPAQQQREAAAGTAFGIGGWAAANPDEVRKAVLTAVQHPRDDANWGETRKVFKRGVLSPWTPAVRSDLTIAQLGRFIPDLGLFERSAMSDAVEYYPLPSNTRGEDPPGLAAAGRYYLKVGGLTKKLPDGTEVPIEVGDQVEVFVEVTDKLRVYEEAMGKVSRRPAGYTDKARSKFVLTDEEVERATGDKFEQEGRLAEKIGKTEQEIEAYQRELGKLLNPKKP